MNLATATLILLPTLMLGTGVALAADSFVYGKLGSGASGASVGFGQVFQDDLVGRVGLGRGWSGTEGADFGGNHYSVKPAAATELAAMLDWYPFRASGLRLSAGLVYRNDAKQALTAHPSASGTYRLNGNSYAASQVGQLQGQTRFYKLAPELSLGWETAAADQPGWRLVSELNLRLNKARQTTLAASGATGNAVLLDDLAAEQRRLGDDVAGGKFHLGASFGAAYSF